MLMREKERLLLAYFKELTNNTFQSS